MKEHPPGPNRRLILEHCNPPSEAPFSVFEYADRLNRIRERMAADGVDLLFLSAPVSLAYVSGYAAEWYQAESPKSWAPVSGIAIHVDDDHFILFDTVAELVMARAVTVATDIRILPRHSLEGALSYIVDEMAAEGWLKEGTRVGLETWSHRPNRAVSEAFQATLESRGATVGDASDILRQVRWTKSPQELVCIEQAARVADIGLRAVQDVLEPGMTELEVYGEAIRAMAAAGGENPGITQPVKSGWKSCTSHPLSSRKAIQAGELVNVDLCGVHNRYHANLARSFHVGEPAADVAAFFSKSAGSFEVLKGILRPNLPVAELNRVMHEYYVDAGIWDERSWIGGYEMGLAFPPDWVGNYYFDVGDTETGDVFEAGSTTNYESIFALPRMAGYTQLIDTILFAEDRAELLGRTQHDLIVVDA